MSDLQFSSSPSAMRTVCRVLYDELRPYICYCNSPENLAMIGDKMVAALAKLDKQGVIDHFHVVCNDQMNPPVNYTTVQLIRATALFKVAVRDEIYHVLFHIHTQDVDVFIHWDNEEDCVADPSPAPEDPIKAYDRAMSIL